ncbi:PH domain-containing protein [Lacticigenium naphthae]|uniref:PH domain-containing protein n=1 Tax=Lacticigenium naphthae TaxID=515351 RepID=UPI00041036AC|nr:PH domain-containing protein [Lacticigenium naphthae]
MNTERKKFHPAVIFVHFIREIRSWLFLIFILFIDTDGSGLFASLGLVALFLFVFAKSLIKYFSQTYQVTADKIVVYRGIFNKRETDIVYDRIQTIKQRQWFFFKPFNIIEILIETASSSPGEAEASLTAVDQSLIETIEQFRNQTTTSYENADRPSDHSQTRFHLTNREIGLYALTDVTAIFVLVTLFTFALEWLPDSIFAQIDSVLAYFQGMMLLILLAVGVAAIGALSVLKNFVLFYNFQASQEEETITLEYGLFERKTQKIPLNKIQGIRIRKQVIRNIFHRSSVELLIMGGQEKEDGGMNIRKVFLFPLIHNDSVYTQLNNFLPTIPIQEPRIQAVSKGNSWYFWRWTLLSGIPLVVGSFFWEKWVAAGLVFVLFIAIGVGWKMSRAQGFSINENILCLQQFQGLSTVQLFIAQKNIQSFTQSTTFWLVKKGLGHMTISFKEGELPAEFKLRFISQNDSAHIYEKFWKQTRSTD